MSKVTYITSTETIDGETLDFGIWDNKGRSVGCTVHIERVNIEVREREPDTTFLDMGLLEDGAVYRFRPQSTRDGEKFGASQMERYFKTEEEVYAAVEKYTSKAKDRAIKNFTA